MGGQMHAKNAFGAAEVPVKFAVQSVYTCEVKSTLEAEIMTQNFAEKTPFSSVRPHRILHYSHE